MCHGSHHYATNRPRWASHERLSAAHKTSRTSYATCARNAGMTGKPFIRHRPRALCRITFLPVTYVGWTQRRQLLSQLTNFKCFWFTWRELQTYMWYHLYSLLRHNWQYVVFIKVAFWHNFPFLTHFRKVNVHHDRYLLISILPTTCLTLWFYTLFDQI